MDGSHRRQDRCGRSCPSAFMLSCGLRLPQGQLLLGAREHPMPYVNVHGVNLYYEEYGEGPAVILTPGGRVDRNGLRPIAALLSPKCRVILHDRRNCGRSDVVIGGDLSEQHLWAEDMAALLKEINAV